VFVILQYGQVSAPPAQYNPVAGIRGSNTIRSLLPDATATNGVMKMVTGSNVGVPGRWIFRVDGATIVPAR
jgi:hypothetical protein